MTLNAKETAVNYDTSRNKVSMIDHDCSTPEISIREHKKYPRRKHSPTQAVVFCASCNKDIVTFTYW